VTPRGYGLGIVVWVGGLPVTVQAPQKGNGGDALIAVNTSLLGARGLEHQDGVPGKSGALKSAE
jgi:hypothetical protein